jgi:hypothetical protein
VTSVSAAGIVATPTPTPFAKNDPLAELEAWNKVKNSKNAFDYAAFLKRFPDGSFADTAREDERDRRPYLERTQEIH